MALDRACVDVQSAGLFEGCMGMLGVTDRALPGLSLAFVDLSHQTACNPRILARQTRRIVAREDHPSGFLLFYDFKYMLNHPFFFIGQCSASFTGTFTPP